ncbi:MAG TPA: hypothetical protein PLW83_06770 [Deltaproteobacteria bacterium]|nr:hypothetical protein [Deltaproteobacteria bacterium]
MKLVAKTALTLVASATIAAVLYLVHSALSAVERAPGLNSYFSVVGVEIDIELIVVVVGSIPVLWLVGFIARTWSLR